MPRRGVGGGGVVVMALALGGAALGLRPSPITASLLVPASPGESAGESPFRPMGAGSCAASACHGGNAPLPAAISPVLRNEHTTWITRDPHANASRVLANERSERIERNLGKPHNAYVPASQDARCLACHALPTAGKADPDLADTIRRDGVSCEACHGDSSLWIGEHTRTGWANLDREGRSQSYNFTNLRDLPTRAKTCAGCHVGAPADPSRGLPTRDVNHDLIAAGHPRLNWEFSAYVANYPKHWVQKDKTPDWDARLWKIGQIATLQAAVDLLAARADGAAEKSAPWPELSEYGCFSCHFSLKEKPFRSNREPGSPLGMPQWASWNLAIVPTLAKIDTGKASEGVDAKIEALQTAMSKLNTDPRLVSEKAQALSAELETWLRSENRTQIASNELAEWVETLNAKNPVGKRTLARSWDSAAQIYLALAAAHASLGTQGQDDPKLRSELESFVKELGFEKGYDSPRGFGTK